MRHLPGWFPEMTSVLAADPKSDALKIDAPSYIVAHWPLAVLGTCYALLVVAVGVVLETGGLSKPVVCMPRQEATASLMLRPSPGSSASCKARWFCRGVRLQSRTQRRRTDSARACGHLHQRGNQVPAVQPCVSVYWLQGRLLYCLCAAAVCKSP